MTKIKCISIYDPIQIKYCNGFKWYPVEIGHGGEDNDGENDEDNV